ncbi:MAG TPA: OsmC family protein [Mycobacteriales bacterium]
MPADHHRDHHYAVTVRWTGNTGEGTVSYRGYQRANEITAAGRPAIPGSSDPTFLGDGTGYSPEELLVAALSQCHMLAYLHMCADSGVVVVSYADDTTGTMVQTGASGRFTEVMLHPVVTVADPSMVDKALAMHDNVHEACFVASSVNFPVRCEASVSAA